MNRVTNVGATKAKLAGSPPNLLLFPSLSYVVHFRLASGDTTTTRRSAGLPYVFLALLHGEPSDKPRLLLDATIRELLTIASGEQGLPPKQESADELALSGSHTLGVTHIRGSSRTGDLKKSLPSAIDAVHNEVARVHALNVLRHIFRDSVFSLSLFPHIGDAVRCSCDGLKAKSWGIVNASTMLFAALVQRYRRLVPKRRRSLS